MPTLAAPRGHLPAPRDARVSSGYGRPGGAAARLGTSLVYTILGCACAFKAERATQNVGISGMSGVFSGYSTLSSKKRDGW